MNFNETVSIIVPIFNVDNYIREALNSLKKQTYKDIEVIMIDDASTDRSSKIAEEFLSDKRFKLFKNSFNKGLSETRNRGIELVNGKYIFYFDPDDLLPLNLLELLIKEFRESKSDLLCFNYLKFSTTVPPEMTSVVDTDDYNQLETIKLLLLNKLTPAPWAYLTYSKVLKDNPSIRFPKGRNFEDITYIPLLLGNINRLRLINFNDGGYYYRVNRKNSITNINNDISKLAQEIDDRVFLDTKKYNYLVENYKQLEKQIKHWYFDELSGLFFEKLTYLYNLPKSRNIFNHFRQAIIDFVDKNKLSSLTYKERVKFYIIKSHNLCRLYYTYKNTF